MTDKIVPIDASPVRRSGASNVAPAHLQREFIGAARQAMGQPSRNDISPFLHKLVTLTFNGDREPATGILVFIIDHPSTGPDSTYLVLDEDEDREVVRYPLNSVQSIELAEAPRPHELPEGS